MSVRPAVNNAFYDELGERWYKDESHAIALLRAESRIKLDYIDRSMVAAGVGPKARVLDIGCGGGFLSNALAAQGFVVRGVDQSAGSLDIARQHAPVGADIRYTVGDALNLEARERSFDVVLLMDVLEHVPDPEQAIGEALRLLASDGVLVYYTFNRTWLAGLLAIKALEWFSEDYPKHLHVYNAFIRPAELTAMIEAGGGRVTDVRGVRPAFGVPFWRSLLRRRVDPAFRFLYAPSLRVGYLGRAMIQRLDPFRGGG